MSEAAATADPLTPSAVQALVSNHRAFLGFLERRVGDRALAEDILQEAFVKGLDKLPALHKDEAVVGWFYRILRNAVVDQHRRRAASSRQLEEFAHELEATSEPSQEVRGAVCSCVRLLAGTLKADYANALERIEVDGLSVKDYAAEAGISSGNAGVRIFRAREALRTRVARSCGTCAEHGCLDCSCKPARKG